MSNITESLKKFNNNIRQNVLELYKLFNYLPCNIDDIDISYERRHYKINIFLMVFKYYKSLSTEYKKAFATEIMPHFMNINWTTVSGLYDPNDEEFVALFNNHINNEFAEKYNPFITKLINN